MKTAWQVYYDRSSDLHLRNPWYREQVERYVIGLWRSDAATDRTSRKLIQRSQRCRAIIRSKQAGVIAGLDEVGLLLRQEGITAQWLKHDGATVKRNQIIGRLSGNARSILRIERTLLNVIQRLSGIATMTAQCVSKVGKRPILAATRKTQWGALDKRAVGWGGGYTHRLGLFDGVMVKDNHLALLEHAALTRVRWGQELASLEIASMTELKRAIIHYPQFRILLLDNFSPARLRLIVRWLEQQHLRKRYILEASGGITPDNISTYVKTGVDVLSLGALTHSVKALDLSLECLPQ